MIWTLPLALLGLLGLPALAAIYILRSRQRPQVVSSLMLFLDAREGREGGRRWQRWQTPLLLLLELLALALLVIAAAGPRVAAGRGVTPVAVVLDDGFAMRAGSPDSPRARAKDAIPEALAELGAFRAHVIRAGREPRRIGEPAESAAAVRRRLERWACASAHADLEAGMSLAHEWLGPRARGLVVTDEAPEAAPEGRWRWRALGAPRPNRAIVSAARARRDGETRLVLELANFAGKPHTARLSVGGETRRVALEPGARRRLRLAVGGEAATVRARLAGDALAADDEVVLLPTAARPVRVALSVETKALGRDVGRAVRASGRGRVVERVPHLLVTEGPAEASTGSSAAAPWRLVFRAGDDPSGFTGPFVVDRAHPLTEGLSFAGAVWAADPRIALNGRPLVTAGNLPLVVLARDGASGPPRLTVRLDPARSSLARTPAWPTFIYNVLAWRGAGLPGLDRVNAPLGGRLELTPPEGVETIRWRRPSGETTRRAVGAGTLAFPADRVGVHELAAGDDRYRFAVNALAPEESDLRDAKRGAWGTWRDRRTVETESISLRWALLLPALGVLLVHGYLVAARGRGRA